MASLGSVAKQAGVSPATVSAVLNGRPSTIGVSAATRERILRAARELNYQGNELARSMVRGRQHVIGLVVPTMGYEVVSTILDGILDAAEKLRYYVKILRADHATGAEVASVVFQYRLAGVICTQMPDAFVASLHDGLTARAIPLVVVDNSAAADWKFRVLSDDREGIRQAVAYLASLGHSRIAFLVSDSHSPWGQVRRQGFINAMKNVRPPDAEFRLFHGMDIQSDFSSIFWNGTQRALRETAVICENDYLAMAFVRAARQTGLHVPRDLSVVGFADLAGSAWCDPALTTVRQPFRAMGAQAMTRLINQIAPAASPAPAERSSERLPTQLIIRQSTAPVPLAPISGHHR